MHPQSLQNKRWYMTKFKILTIAFLIFIFNVKAFALDANYKNALKEIDVQKSTSKGYTINLIFEKPYKEPLALKKKTPGEYTILLPETKLASDNVSVLYEAAKGLVDFDIAQNSYLDEKLDNGYVKITVKTKNSIPLNVASGIAIKTNLEKIQKDDVMTIVPKVADKTVPEESTNAPKQTYEEPLNQDIEPIPETTAIPAPIDTKTTITLKEKIKQKAINIKHNYSFKKLLKLGLIGIILLTLLNQMLKIKNTIKENKKSKFTAQSGVIKKDKTQKAEKNNEDMPTLYSAPTFGTMSQHSPVQNNSPEEALKRISSSQNVAQTSRIEPAMKQDSTVRNQTNPFVSSIKEQEQTVPQKQQQVEEEEIKEEAPNPDYPELVSQIRISKNKGLYLVNYNEEYSLLGYINDKIFVIKKFDTIMSKKLQVRVNAKTEKSTTYIVRLDNYKALIDVSASNMKTLIEF